MDLPTLQFFQPQPLFTSHGESPIESNMNLYGKNKNNPFEDDFPDPLCKLNLKETSEFVKSFPIPNGNAETNNNNNNNNNTVTQQHRRLEAPSTPGRPVFSFTNVGLGRNLSRKNFPSKWDDAEKWLMSTTTSSFCHDSPAHVNLSLSESSKNSRSSSRQCDNFKQQVENKVTVNGERVSKTVPTFQKSASLDHYNPFAAFNGVVSASPTDHMVLKDKFTDSIEPILPNSRYLEPTKEVFLFRNPARDTMKDACTEVIHDVQHKDAGTEMDPLGISTTSRCHTPIKSSSPARHNTPASMSGLLALPNPNGTSCTIDLIQLEECHFSKLKLGAQYDFVTSNWSTSEEDEEEISKSLRHNSSRKADSECRAATWEEEEKNKYCLRYQREEARIQAWVNLQNAKAEAHSRKLEVKIQKMRSNLEEKLMKRMSIVHRKAEEWRKTARQQHLEQIQKATEQAQKMIHKHNTHSTRHSSCGCFPFNNNYH
ncbi:hypothetical protein Lal_00030778 [Lupinus albus]|uniref:Putative remorin n=1 Tax=Lupinus albus TaxID=3870 RepID=A0A6A4P354_LUPAL|nr:putative remorin [Lupinus albus]KAF1863697.1 hypothetical protein Lal_00030778 [Lupinus albus]